MKYQANKGIGIFAAIVIVALLAVGGVAAVKVSQKNKTAMEAGKMEAESAAETKTTVNAKLGELKATLSSNLAVDAKLAQATLIIGEIRTVLGDAYASAKAESKSELNALQNRIDELEAQLATDAEANVVVGNIDDLIVDVKASLESDAEVESMESDVPDQAHTEGETSTDSDTENGNSSENDGSTIEAGVSGSVDIETN